MKSLYYRAVFPISMILFLYSLSAIAGLSLKISEVKQKENSGYEIAYSLIDEDKSISYDFVSDLHVSKGFTEFDDSFDIENSSGNKEEATRWIESVKKWTGKCHASFPSDEKPYYIIVNVPKLNIVNKKHFLSDQIISSNKISIPSFEKNCEVEFNHEFSNRNDQSTIEAKIYVRDNLGEEELIQSNSFILKHDAIINERFSSLIPQEKIESKNIEKYKLALYTNNSLIPAQSEVYDFTCPSVPGVKKLLSPQYIGIMGQCTPLPYEKAVPCQLISKNQEDEEKPEMEFLTINPTACVHQYFYTENSKIFVPEVYEGEACTYIPPFSGENKTIRSYRFTLIDNGQGKGKKIPLSPKSNYTPAFSKASSHSEFKNGLFELADNLYFDKLDIEFNKPSEKTFIFRKKDFKYPLFEADSKIISTKENLDSFQYSKLLNSITLDFSKLSSGPLKEQVVNILETKTGIRRVHIENFDVLDPFASRILNNLINLQDTIEIIVSTENIDSEEEFIIFKRDSNNKTIISKDISLEKQKKEEILQRESENQKKIRENDDLRLKRLEEERKLETEKQKQEELKKQELFNELEKENNILQNKIETTNQMITELKLEIKNVCSTKDDLENSLKLANTKEEELKKEKEKLENKIEHIIQLGRSKVQELNQKILLGEDERKSFVLEIDQKKRESEKLSKEINELEQEKNKLLSRLERTLHDLSSLRNSMLQREEMIKSLKQECEISRDSFQNFKIASEKDHDKLINKIDSISVEKSKLQDNYSKLSQENEILKRNLESKNTETLELSSKLGNTTNELSRIKNASKIRGDKLDEELKALKSNYSDLQEEEQGLQKSLKETTESFNKKCQELLTTSEENKGLKTLYSLEQERANCFEEDFKKRNSELEKLKKSYDNLNRSYKKWLSQGSTLKHHHGNGQFHGEMILERVWGNDNYKNFEGIWKCPGNSDKINGHFSGTDFHMTRYTGGNEQYWDGQIDYENRSITGAVSSNRFNLNGPFFSDPSCPFEIYK